ncbi:hypothetical protein NL676_017695 [Syzygium grande]|nr:hypothetical protein NL676_017695 [Syzygium grande]
MINNNFSADYTSSPPRRGAPTPYERSQKKFIPGTNPLLKLAPRWDPHASSLCAVPPRVPWAIAPSGAPRVPRRCKQRRRRSRRGPGVGPAPPGSRHVSSSA